MKALLRAALAAVFTLYPHPLQAQAPARHARAATRGGVSAFVTVLGPSVLAVRAGGTGPGWVLLRAPANPVVVETGRQDRPWRLLPARRAGRRLEFQMSPGMRAQVWPAAAFIATHAGSDLAAAVRWGVSVGLRPEFPGPGPLSARDFPGEPEPVHVEITNTGRALLSNVRVRLQPPEGWRRESALVAPRLPRGGRGSADPQFTPPVHDAPDIPVPMLVWITFSAPDGEHAFPTALDVTIERAADLAARCERDGRLAIKLTSHFPSRRLTDVGVAAAASPGRSVQPARVTFDLHRTRRLRFHVVRPAGEPWEYHRTGFTVRAGRSGTYWPVADSAAITLGPDDGEDGIKRVPRPSLLAEPVTVAGRTARRFHRQSQLPGRLEIPFRLSPFLPVEGPTWIGVEVLDEGTGRLRCEIASLDALPAPLGTEARESPTRAQEGSDAAVAAPAVQAARSERSASRSLALHNTGRWVRLTFPVPALRGPAPAHLALTLISNASQLTLHWVGVSKWAR